MNSSNKILVWSPGLPGLAVLLLLAATAGCRRDEVQVYQVEKEKPASAQPASPHGANPHGEMGNVPKLGWKLPPGWTEQAPSTMRAASFAIKGPEEQKADVAVIPLPGVTGRDLELVNMWRSQAGLEPVKAGELDGLLTKVPVGPGEGKLFDMVSQEPPEGQKHPVRITAAMLDHDGTGWFFKMTGPDALVQSQKAAFLEFLKSVEFPAGGAPSPGVAGLPHGGMTMAAPPVAAGDAATNPNKPNWTVPAGWQELPGGQFLVAKFALTGEGGAQAAVNVSRSPGEGGGWVLNVNRWRKQLGLSELSAEEMNKATTSADVAGGKAMLVELTGTDARTGQPAGLVGAMVPQSGQSWFYKLMGEAKVVESQKDAFTKFVQSVKY